jgi:cytochrome c5
MPKLRAFLPAAIILVGMLLVACGAFAAVPTLTPALVPSATHLAIPTVTKISTASIKPADTATLAPLPLPTETPAGLDGKTLLAQRCNACHPSSYVTQLRGTADQWAGLVNAMVQNGADLNPQEQQVLANYLAQMYH